MPIKPLLSAHSIEALEPRIAPATLLNPHTVQYTDSDGDTVTVKTTKGTWDLAADLVFSPSGSGEMLIKINLASKQEFRGASLSIQADGAGNGLADVGLIDATNVDLGKVKIGGDLGNILAGSGSKSGPAIALLQVNSIGALGLASQGNTGSVGGTINGVVNIVKIAEDFIAGDLQATSFGRLEIGDDLVYGNITATKSIGSVQISGDVFGSSTSAATSGKISAPKIGSVMITGSLFGGKGSNSGSILADRLGSVVIGENVFGGSGTKAGSIIAQNSLGTIQIGHAIYGGKGLYAGSIVSDGSIKSVETGADGESGGSLFGDDGSYSGSVFAMKKIGKVLIRESIFGGHTTNSGVIHSEAGRIGTVKVRGSVYGGSLSQSGGLFDSGEITAVSIGSVHIGGNLYGGSGTNGGSVFFCGAIRATQTIGSVTIDGTVSAGSDRVTISATGLSTKNSAHNLAIGSIKIGDSVSGLDVLAGYDFIKDGVNIDAKIGSITFKGDVRGTNLVAGVITGSDSYFGDVNDMPIDDMTDGPAPSKIGKITIGGVLEGSSGGSDRFGFVAQQIDQLKIGGMAIKLPVGASKRDPVQIAATTGDVYVVQV